MCIRDSVDDRAGIDPANVRLQVTHAASTVGEVDIYEVSDPANPAALLSDVPYKASDTLNVPVADYLIGIDADNDPSTIEFTYDVGLAALGLPGGTFLNVYANESTDGVDLVVQQDDGSVLVIPPTTTTSIRVMHLGNGVPAVDVYANAALMAVSYTHLTLPTICSV